MITQKGKRVLSRVLTYAGLVLGSMWALLPLLWAFSTSLKSSKAIAEYPPRWIPPEITLHHYEKLLFRTPLLRYAVNTLVVALLCILLTLFVAALGAYVTARFDFKGKGSLMFALLATSMLPGIATLPAVYVLAVKTGLYDTLAVLVLVFSAWRAPSVMWLLRGFFQGIPQELEEAAMIDGCSRIQAIVRIVLPLAQPGLAAASVLIFVFVWNTWVFPAALTVSGNVRVITIGLYSCMTELGVDWGGFTAYAILAALPVVALFLLLQTRFIEGLTSGASKG